MCRLFKTVWVCDNKVNTNPHLLPRLSHLPAHLILTHFLFALLYCVAPACVYQTAYIDLPSTMVDFQPTPPPVHVAPGKAPTPEQLRQIQAHMQADARRMGLTMEAYTAKLKELAMRQQQQMQMQAQAQQQQAGQGQQEPSQPGPPKPEALAVANFLRSQDLKPRTCIFNEKRKDMFRVKRAIRALHSEAYAKARAKNPLLPEVKDRVTAENTFKLLPLSMLALRVSKIDPNSGHDGHGHSKKKRIKGLWTVKIEQQQEAHDDMHYMWLYEGSQWKQKAYAIGALLLVFTVVMFPLWPLVMRQGVWYLSMAMLGVIGLFFVMSIFRLILFCVTMITNPPGLWLFPNLFEDVGFFDSFKPVWAWHETEAVSILSS
jgi:translocation protein SEC62